MGASVQLSLAPFYTAASKLTIGLVRALPPMVSARDKAAAQKALAHQVASGTQATLAASVASRAPPMAAARSHVLELTASVQKDFEDRTQINRFL